MTTAVQKRLVFILLILISAIILAWGIWQYRLFWEWMAPRHIEGIGLILLGSFGFTALFIPFVIKRDWAESSPGDVAKAYVISFGLMFAALTAVFLMLWVLGFVLRLLRIYPVILFALVILIVVLPWLIPIVRKYLFERRKGRN